MFCSNCGTRLPEGTKFCTNCGLPVESPAQGAGDQAAADETVAMPSPSTGSGPAREYVPISIDEPAVAPEPAAPSYASSAPQRSGGTSPVTIVMALIAAVAVIALVVVVADPFHMGGSDPAPQQQVVAEEEPKDDAADDEASTEDESTADDAPAEEADADEDVTGDESADDSSRGGDNNVVVVVGDDGRDEPSGGDTIVVHESPDGYVLPNSSSHTYSAGELSHLTDWELYLARNEIYARHGREFHNDDLQRYFNGQSWYTPVYSPEDFDARSGSILSSVEQKNAATILSIEQSRGSAYI